MVAERDRVVEGFEAVMVFPCDGPVVDVSQLKLHDFDASLKLCAALQQFLARTAGEERSAVIKLGRLADFGEEIENVLFLLLRSESTPCCSLLPVICEHFLDGGFVEGLVGAHRLVGEYVANGERSGAGQAVEQACGSEHHYYNGRSAVGRKGLLEQVVLPDVEGQLVPARLPAESQHRRTSLLPRRTLLLQELVVPVLVLGHRLVEVPQQVDGSLVEVVVREFESMKVDSLLERAQKDLPSITFVLQGLQTADVSL
jgi:hypothetical protein